MKYTIHNLLNVRINELTAFLSLTEDFKDGKCCHGEESESVSFYESLEAHTH